MIYTIPAVGALIIMVLFGIFFHEEKATENDGEGSESTDDQ
jgi:hypothetical protein